MNKVLFIILFTSFIFYFIFGVYVYKLDRKSITNRSFLVLCINVSVWSLGYAFMLASEDKNSANFWRVVAALGWCFFCTTWVLFSHCVKNNNKKRVNIKRIIILYIPSIIFCLNTLRYSAEQVVIKTKLGWVERDPIKSVQVLFKFYWLILIIYGVNIIYCWGKQSSSNREKKQAQIIVRTAVVSIVLGAPTDIFLPIFGVKVFPSAIIVISIAMLGIWHSIKKYKMMSITPQYVSDYMFKAVKDPIFFLGEDFCVKDINETAQLITKYSNDELKNKSFISLMEKNNLEFGDLLKEKSLMNFEVNLLTKNNHKIPCLLSGTLVKDDLGDILGIVIVLHDISYGKKIENILLKYNNDLENEVKERTFKLQESNEILHNEIVERKIAEERIQYMAYYDELTGLPNRRYFNEYITKYVNDIKDENRYFAIMFLDLDNFKLINDTCGHEKGDILLQQFATRMKNIIGENNVLARIGGDEFLFLVTDLSKQVDINAINLISNKIITIFKEPFYIDGKENFSTVSIGIALYPKDGQDVETLMRNADITLYEAKHAGKNNYKICTSKSKESFMEKTKFRNSLYRALEKGELEVYYQPQIDINLNKITGFEALLRWKIEGKTFISPAEFIPIAEETGLIVPIGYWVINTACSKLKQWHNSGFKNLSIAINLSYNQLKEKNFIGKVKEILEAVDLDTGFLEFEVTERITLRGIDENIKVLDEIKNMGIKISIDDFGTDYSSFMNIKRLPIDKIKISMDFIRGLGKNNEDSSIVNCIVDLSHNIGFTVIAEGVETKDQLEYLKNIGCDEVQGYYYYKPMSHIEMEEVLNKEQK